MNYGLYQPSLTNLILGSKINENKEPSFIISWCSRQGSRKAELSMDTGRPKLVSTRLDRAQLLFFLCCSAILFSSESKGATYQNCTIPAQVLTARHIMGVAFSTEVVQGARHLPKRGEPSSQSTMRQGRPLNKKIAKVNLCSSSKKFTNLDLRLFLSSHIFHKTMG